MYAKEKILYEKICIMSIQLPVHSTEHPRCTDGIPQGTDDIPQCTNLTDVKEDFVKDIFSSSCQRLLQNTKYLSSLNSRISPTRMLIQ